MDIFAHRGMWKDKHQQNSLTSLLESIEHGYSIETDIWRVGDKLIISHDPPEVNRDYLNAAYFMSVIEERNLGAKNITIAWNIKSDACEALISDLLSSYKHLAIKHFFFDMSIPSMIALYKYDPSIPLCTRLSDVETTPVFYNETFYIWVDSFFSEKWIEAELLIKHHREDKYLIIVSPELHKRDHETMWEMLTEYLQAYPEYSENIGICTDYPELATQAFRGGTK